MCGRDEFQKFRSVPSGSHIELGQQGCLGVVVSGNSLRYRGPVAGTRGAPTSLDCLVLDAVDLAFRWRHRRLGRIGDLEQLDLVHRKAR